MKPVVAVIAVVAALVLSLPFAPRSGHAGAAATTAASMSVTPAVSGKNCYFVRNHLPCPCPKAQKARALANAARITFGAIGNAMGTTTVALTRPETKHDAPADTREAPAKR